MSDELLNAMVQDAVGVSVTTTELLDISTLAARQLELEEKVRSIESDLKAANEELRQVQEFLLPEAMASVGMAEFKMEDGRKVTIREDIFASIRADHTEAAFEWLASQGLGDIIKDEVRVRFGKGESDKALEVVSFCKDRRYNAEEKMTVNPQTLKATIKEQMARGVQFPEEMFSVAPYKKAVIKNK